jgi:Family of unknown function (DUF6399)
VSTCQASPTRPATEEPFRYPRRETAGILHDGLHPDRAPLSGRDQARQAGIPHTTLHYWRQRQQRTEAPAALVALFDSPEGLAFLQQLLLALHLVFQQAGTAGIRPPCRFLQLAGLAPFVAASYGTHQHLATLLQELLGQYDQEQRQRLGPAMPARTITLCEDENFHGPQPCLVAIEPLANFIVLEAYQPQRDALTWDATVRAALQGLPVTVVQVTSDLAQGLQAHARDGLGAHHSPDLMHVQADLFKATALAFQRHAEQARQRLQDAQAKHQAWLQRQQEYQSGRRPPGRPPDFAREVRWAGQRHEYWQGQVQQREQHQEQAAQAARGLGDDYHPFDAQTGQPVSAEQVQQRLEQRFERIEHLAEEVSLSEACQQKLGKARRVLPRLVATVAWFWQQTHLLVESLRLPEAAERAVYEQLLPGLYWQRAAERAGTAAEKQRLRELARGLLEAAWSAGSVLSGVGVEMQEIVRRVCEEAAGRFVRASSCVEGRNGQLSLYHHGCHALSPGRLRALTVLHNYFIERPDGTTAAERFYGEKPADLFEWLLERFPDPPRPAQQRRESGRAAS